MDREAITSHGVLERVLLDKSAEPTQLPLSLLEGITNRFSPDHQIGIGGFAVVYKGMVGKGMVAVKKLSNTFCIHENDFKEEVKCMVKAKHKNIVRFLGYCADTQGKMEMYEGNLVMADQRNWLLCFEYVCNGSLDKYITDASLGLNWRARYRIIKGICEGLLYLHDNRILHLDLKPANILLDAHMVPKICDFGLSRCLGEEQTRAITKSRRGTLGYMDPEYLRSGRIALASDIYSLGVIIIEIITGVKWYIEEEKVVESWMNRLKGSDRELWLEQVRVCTKIAIECMNVDPKKRPVARHIIDMLDETTSADYSYETGTSSSLAELQVCLPREQLGEGIEDLAAESFQEAEVEKHSEVLEDSSWGAQNTKHKTTSMFGSIPTMFNKLNNLSIFNRKSQIYSSRNSLRRQLAPWGFIKIFRKKEIKPILRSCVIIGECSIGVVYKGVVDGIQVAVKKFISVDAIEHNQLATEQFANEVIIQSRVIHKNLVRLIGYCLEMDSPIILYEFISRGSLHDILHGDKKMPLGLDLRLTIVAESAQGLAYLHSQSQARHKIIHRDVKPTSILLDDNFMPKISGFGLSRYIETNMEYTHHIAGIMAYMDPVYMKTGLLTEKSDVYSFGIVILEIISRKMARSNDYNLVRSFLEVHEGGKKATDLFDKEIAVTMGDLEILDSLAEIALECLKLDVDQRPMMPDVAARLLILNRSRRSQVVPQ